MPLLVLDRVWKRYARGLRERIALRDVSLELEAGELAAVWGRRHSGRTTLLRVAAGIEEPSGGVVRFDGSDLARRTMLGARGGVGYCTTRFAHPIGESVVEHVAAPLLGRRASVREAETRARCLLERVGAADCAAVAPSELEDAEAQRVGLARALATDPRLLLFDEPSSGVPPASSRDGLHALLRSLVSDDGIAVLMTVAEASDLAGVDRAFTIDAGELRGDVAPRCAEVVPLHIGGLRANGRA